MNIRIATVEDFELIWPFFQDIVSCGDTYAYPSDLDKESALHIWMEYPRETFVYEEDGIILGTYYIKTNHDGAGRHICNCGFMVAPEARGKGVATTMCEHSQRMACDFGYKGMQFNFVFSSNTSAVNLWKRMGYEIVGTLPKACYLSGKGYVDAYVMYKWLEENND